MIPVQLFNLALGLRTADSFPRFFHRVLCRIIGFRVVVRGTLSQDRPVMIASNHLSYLDIPIYGSVVAGSFVSKAEVASWPVFGMLAKLQRTVFVDRRRSSTGQQRDNIQARLDRGDRLILFPEGTSADGTRVLPFKSALFAAAAAEDGQVTVQPATIAYTRLDDVPLGRGLRPYFAWYGDMELAGHAFEALGLGRTTVEITFHEPVTLARFGSRKALADYCQGVVSRGLAASNSGRDRSREAP